MSTSHQKYCLDANVLIEAWQKYYSPKFCPDYWNLLNQLGRGGTIFLPQLVAEEIFRTDDDLSKWLEQSDIPVYKNDEAVIRCLKEMYAANPLHEHLVNNIKQRSLADPWVVAHAMNEKACVVTKEVKVTAINAGANRIRIPDVCENMKIKCINDFQLVEELNMHFSCSLR